MARATGGTNRMAAAFGAAVVGALAGCAGSGGASAVSVSNLSDRSLAVRASLDLPPGTFDDLAEPPVTTSEVTLEPGSQAGLSLEHPGVESPSVQFVVRVLGEPPVEPYTFRMGPPGPYLLKISGPASDLRLEREVVSPTREDDLVPDDPRERRWRGGFPS